MIKGEQKKADIEEGTLRLMTLGEIAMAQRVFGHSVACNRVWIHCDRQGSVSV